MMGKSLNYAYPQSFAEGGDVKMTDLTTGKNEELGNDMVLLTFADGSKRQTQKALYEAAQSLGAFDNMQSGDDFADWHLNTWAGNVVSDPQYMAAHDQFNTGQIAYNQTLMDANPEIAKNRLAFTQQYAPNNQAALDAAQSLVDQYYGPSPSSLTSMTDVNMLSPSNPGGIATLVPDAPPEDTSKQNTTYGSNPSDYVVGSLSSFYRPPTEQYKVPTMFGGPVNTQQVRTQAVQSNNPFVRR